MLRKKLSKVLVTMIITSSFLIGCSNTSKEDILDNQVTQNQAIEDISINKDNTSNSEKINEEEKVESGKSKVHFIDTGNSDSILIENNGEYMLIDGGDTDDDAVVNNYLNKQGVKTIKYLLATHPHADHLGALDTVVKNFEIENLFIGSGTANTKVYTQFINNATNKGYTPIKPKENTIYSLGDGQVKFYNVNGQGGKDLNNESVIALYSNGDDDFLFTGDAETEVEMKYASVIGDIDVYKASHHGSRTGSSQSFLNIIKPEYVLLLTGTNSYGHPHKEVVDRLKNNNIAVYRSDESGDIIATSTGNGITFNTNVDSYKSGNSLNTIVNDNENTSNNVIDNTTTNNNDNIQGQTYYYTPNGKSYHTTKDCPTLSRSKTILNDTLDNIKAKGKTDPCDKCN